MDLDVDKEIKRLRREIFYLDKEKNQIKKEIWSCNIEKRVLEKENDNASKKRYLKVLKQLYILSSNYELKTNEILRRRKMINKLEEMKSKSHQHMKRRLTKERHYEENVTLVGDFE